MGLFDKIKDKLGMNQDAKQDTPVAGATAGPESVFPDERPSTTNNATTGPGRPVTDEGSASPTAAAPAPAPAADSARTTVFDVAAKLDEKAASHPEKLNWRTSIVDLLKLLDLDSSLGARKELATELGCPADKMGDSAQMNMWLHTEVMRKLVEHGGSVPPELAG
ncbi:DUF3597 domain-containing protein [Stutzerimonas tarimensis]|uniref:DUF3597 domain-containing protein n=1 Tax=Stutzerimonas tarimensis TaxID=1507735 RepID=A0ABV7T0Q5_9GAMM